MTISTLSEALDALSTQLGALATLAQRATRPDTRDALATAIDKGIDLRDFLLSIRQAHGQEIKDRRLKQELEKYNNYLHRTFGV